MNSYHRNPSILFQFILSEFLLSFGEILKLYLHFHQRAGGSLKQDSAEELIKDMLLGLEKVLGAAFDVSWGAEDGYLYKLYAYSSLFFQIEQTQAREILYHQAKQCLFHCHHLNDLMVAIQTIPFSEWPDTLSIMMPLIEGIHSQIHKLGNHLREFIHKFREDENIIFFILNHRDIFDAYFGEGYVKRLLQQAYGDSLKEAKQIIVEKYSKRGFIKLLSIISEKFERLESIA